jgi:hypothetical protein
MSIFIRTVTRTYSKQELAAYAANKRWQVEVGGCLDPQNRSIATDRESQTKLLAELVDIMNGIRTDPSVWKCGDGSYAVLTNAEMQAVIMAARSHISNAFAIEGQALAAIAAETITTPAEIDALNWP